MGRYSRDNPPPLPAGFHHPMPDNPSYPHSCDGCWCEGQRDRAEYGWPHDTTPEETKP